MFLLDTNDIKGYSALMLRLCDENELRKGFMYGVSTSRWRTYDHPGGRYVSFASCQIIDQRTRVIHLIPLHSHHYYTAQSESGSVDERAISNALWPTASEAVRKQLPEMLIRYLTQLRGHEFPVPSGERKMISLTVYVDGSHSWPAITTLTEAHAATPV